MDELKVKMNNLTNEFNQLKLGVLFCHFLWGGAKRRATKSGKIKLQLPIAPFQWQAGLSLSRRILFGSQMFWKVDFNWERSDGLGGWYKRWTRSLGASSPGRRGSDPLTGRIGEQQSSGAVDRGWRPQLCQLSLVRLNKSWFFRSYVTRIKLSRRRSQTVLPLKRWFRQLLI